ncbi:MAG: acetyl-CoA carboxylase biotin carboxyl carrier protein subunit [Alphaproteobacteria bacterium]
MSDEFDVDAGLVRKLADLLAETGLGEIEYEADGRRIRVARPGVATAPAVVQAAPEPAAPSAAVAPAASGPHPGAVTSPMVGTVYLSSGPGEPPMIKVGQRVSQGQTLLLIEAMKVYNEIRAPRTGTVVELGVANGQPVEYGEVLAVIE